MSQIKKIDIMNFGSFKNYTWINRDTEFKSVNIIYGRNYSGKTTLSRIFKCLEDKELHNDYENPQFTFFLDNEIRINQTLTEIDNVNICVYNTDFIKKNLNWLHNSDGSIEPFTVLGENNNEVENKILDISNILGDNPDIQKENLKKGLLYNLTETQKKYEEALSNFKFLSNELENKLKNKANQEIKINSLYQNVNYNITSIKKDIMQIEENVFTPLNNDLIEKNINLIKEDIKSDIKELPEQKPNFEKYYLEVKLILEEKIKPSKPIQELLNNSLLQEWVRKGKEYHENKRESCAFCGNPINENLWEKLDEHFSKESEELRDKINKKILELESKKNALENFMSFTKKAFYSILQEKVEQLLQKWEILKSNYKTNIEKLIIQLERRLNDIFKDIEIEQLADVSDDIFELIKEVNLLIIENNQMTLTLSTKQTEAREELRLSEVSKFLKDIDYAKKIIDIKNAETVKNEKEQEKNNLDSTIKKYQEDIRKLQTELKDESKGAELVNEYLERFFGHNGFKLVALDENTGVKYKILRDSKEAKNLSEGECSLISFCYFIAKIKDKLGDEINPNSLILYIDDPISSLDSNHIFFIFSLIEHIITKPKKYKQLFISTHNLDFLKYIKRFTASKDELMHFIIEMKQKQNDKTSTLNVMPEHLKDYTTEFNYLFNELYKLYREVRGDRTRLIENTYNQFYNIPNNIRKFLEYYLFYKYPNTVNPLENLDKLFDGEIPAKINRIVNELSHLTFIDRGWSPMDVPEIEECVKIVLDKIKEKDEEQFNALIESVK